MCRGIDHCHFIQRGVGLLLPHKNQLMKDDVSLQRYISIISCCKPDKVHFTNAIDEVFR
jgi:hypothetical protein